MAKLKYTLNGGEKIVYKLSNIKYNSKGLYTNTLIITNQSLILEKYGLFHKFLGIQEYVLDEIENVRCSLKSDDDLLLEVFANNTKDVFSIESDDDEYKLKILAAAICDQKKPNPEMYDADYYKDLESSAEDNKRLLELKAKAGLEPAGNEISAVGIVGNVLKSGDLSIGGIAKGITKASKQKKQGGLMDGFLEEIGVHDIQDEFTEVGNDFREGFGLKPKMTHADYAEIKELEEKIAKRQIKDEVSKSLDKTIETRNQSLKQDDGMLIKHEPANKSNLDTVNYQFEALKKAKELLDLGVLTQEEFDQKKKEIMNS